MCYFFVIFFKLFIHFICSLFKQKVNHIQLSEGKKINYPCIVFYFWQNEQPTTVQTPLISTSQTRNKPKQQVKKDKGTQPHHNQPTKKPQPPRKQETLRLYHTPPPQLPLVLLKVSKFQVVTQVLDWYD